MNKGAMYGTVEILLSGTAHATASELKSELDGNHRTQETDLFKMAARVGSARENVSVLINAIPGKSLDTCRAYLIIFLCHAARTQKLLLSTPYAFFLSKKMDLF